MIMNNYFLLKSLQSNIFKKLNCHSFNKQCTFLYLKHTNISTNIIAKRTFSIASWPAFLSNCAPVAFLQNSIVNIHNVTGLPWWAVILLTTLGLRSAVMFPFAVHQAQVVGRLLNLKKELDKIAPELNKEVSIAARMYNWDYKTAKSMFNQTMRKQRTKLIVRDNCHPLKVVIIVIIQLPIWVCFSTSLRNIAYMLPHRDAAALMIFEQLKLEGFLWFANMTVPDSSFIIPLCLGIVNLSLIEFHSLRQVSGGSLIEKIVKYISRATTLLLMFFATITPATVSFYWLCSSTFGLAQNLILMSPTTRRMMSIPKTPMESQTPYKDVFQNLKKKIARKAS